MAKISYHRLADGLVKMLDTHSVQEAVAATVSYASAKGAKLDLERLISEVERALYEQKGHAVVHVTSARELTTSAVEHAATDLAEKIESTSHEVVTSINPDLLGGVVTSAAGVQQDHSVRRKLQQIGVHNG